VSASIRRVQNWNIASGVVAGAARRSLAAPRQLRSDLLKSLWIEVKRFSAPKVRNVQLSNIAGLEQISVDGPVMRHCSLVLAALGKLLGCKTIFEFGTYRGDTTWLLAHNLPEAHVYTLDLAGPEAVSGAQLELTDAGEYFGRWDRGARFRGRLEANRISQLFGDSATFDFSPYAGAIDLVYVDASHSYSYVRSDTEAALRMLSASGTIVWDDYTHYPGIWAYLNELAPTLERPIFHILGTRLAVYSRRELTSVGLPEPASMRD
jgi:predicted O-methyltransferase YrrM